MVKRTMKEKKNVLCGIDVEINGIAHSTGFNKCPWNDCGVGGVNFLIKAYDGTCSP